MTLSASAAVAGPGTHPPALVVDRLTHSFGAVSALSGVSFEVAPGELFGLIGPDGSGKTTLFRILTSLLVADGGEARVLDLDPVADLWELRRRIGYMPGRFSLYPDLSVAENLEFFASVFATRVEAQYDLIAPIYHQLEPFANRRAGDLSGGMKQKLALSCALVHRPEILVLDEPTTGVDAVSRREFWDLLTDLRAAGMTILVSTPYMDEAARCDRVALIQGGRILDVSRPDEFGERYPLPLFAVRAADRVQALAALRDHPHAHSSFPFGELLHHADLRSDEDHASLALDLKSYLAARIAGEVEVAPLRAGIEDSFMMLMTGGSGGVPG